MSFLGFHFAFVKEAEVEAVEMLAASAMPTKLSFCLSLNQRLGEACLNQRENQSARINILKEK